MGREAFLVFFKQQVTDTKEKTTTTQNTTTVITMIDRVAKFLGLDNASNRLTLDLKNTKKRAGYKKKGWKKDEAGEWVQEEMEIPEAEIPITFSSKARTNKITLFVRGKGANAKSQKQVTVTAPATLTVAQIADALGDLIPTSKRGTTATDLYPYFSINGGRRYPIPTKAQAEATPEVNVPDTQAEIQTVLSTAEPQKPTK